MDIILKGKDGNDVEYSGVETMTFDTPEGGLATFTAGEAVENVPVVLDFSDGNQIVIADDGKLMKSVVIEKPENLIPTNIKKDEVIGGIKGTLDSGLDEQLRYFTCNIDHVARVITLYSILYDKIYEDTGSYDVTIPDTINGFNVMIKA